MIVCLGIGPGDLRYVTQGAIEQLQQADFVAGFDSVLNFVAPLASKSAIMVPMNYSNQTSKLAELAVEHHAGKKCVVCFMGDIHFSGFQLLERVERACGHPVETHPGISSAQVLAAKTRVCFDETTFITLHRRGDIEPFKQHLVAALRDGRNAIVIPRPWDVMPKDVAAHLLNAGIPPQQRVEVWENLTQSEASWSGCLSECVQDFSDMSIMLVRTLTPAAVGV